MGFLSKGEMKMTDWKLIDEKNQEIADQNRKIEDKAKLIKGVDKANSEMSEEITKLKQLAKTKNARTLERIGRIEQQEREIAELKSLAAYAEQRANIAEKANDALVLKNASLSSQVTRGVDDCNKLVIENNELKAQVEQLKLTALKYRRRGVHIELLSDLNKTPAQCLQSVKADAVKDFMEHIQYSEDDGLIDEEYINESYDFWIKMREGKS